MVLFISLQEGRYEESCAKFTTAMNVTGYKPDLSYNIALCHYMMKQYSPALRHIANVIEGGIKEHPELSVGMTTEGLDVRSVGNTLTLHETALIEAFNLKAAIEYQLKNCEYCFLRVSNVSLIPQSVIHTHMCINISVSPVTSNYSLPPDINPSILYDVPSHDVPKARTIPEAALLVLCQHQ